MSLPPVRRRSRVEHGRVSAARRLAIAGGVLAVLALLGWVVWQLQAEIEREDAQARAWEEEQRRRVDYRADLFHCGLRFPSGGVDRATWYEDGFRWRGVSAELATSRDDSEGEQWAEFYAPASAELLEPLLQAPLADAAHPLIRRRLESLYYPDHPHLVAQFEDRLQVYASGAQEGWRVRAAWFAAPFGDPSTYPPAGPRDAIDRRDIVDHLAREAPWLWRRVEDMPERALWESYRRAEYNVHAQWSGDTRQRDRMVAHFRNTHRNFYILDAAKELAPGKVLILRRFGQLAGSQTLAGAARRLHDMIRSVRCSAVEAAPEHAELEPLPSPVPAG